MASTTPKTCHRQCTGTSGITLSDRALGDLEPPTTGRRWVYDNQPGGLAAMQTPAGAVVMYAIATARGQRMRVRLGRWPGLTVVAARLAAQAAQAKIAAGADLRTERRVESERRAQRRAEVKRARLPVWSEVWTAFDLERSRNLRPRTWTIYSLRWRECLEPTIGAQRIDQLGKGDALTLHAKYGRERGTVTANRAHALGRLLWRFAAQRHDLTTANPWCSAKPFAESPRQRSLSVEETRALLREIEAEDPTPRDALRLLLLTGARISNVRLMAWADLSDDLRTWTVPPWRAKAKRAIPIPLPPACVAMLEKRQRVNEYVFPGTFRPAMSEPVMRSAWRSACARAGIVGATPHDARRGLATTLTAAGVSLSLVSRLLGHGGTAVTEARYVRLTADAVRPATELAANLFVPVIPPATPASEEFCPPPTT